MVLTLPARSSFRIIARYNGLGGGFGSVLPLKARAGRTCEALATFLRTKSVLSLAGQSRYIGCNEMLSKYRNYLKASKESNFVLSEYDNVGQSIKFCSIDKIFTERLIF